MTPWSFDFEIFAYGYITHGTLDDGDNDIKQTIDENLKIISFNVNI